METPSSTRLTNSIQVSRKIENSEKNRCALMDLTNDSPIVGLADGVNVEKQSAKKHRESRVKNAPGSGEALLRFQAKTLLQKVEEDASDPLASITPSVVIQQQPIHQVVNEEDSECEKSVITKSLFMDFSENSQVSDASEGSVVSSCCSIKKHSVTTDDDDSSVWSMQVNAEDNEEEEEEYEDEEIVVQDVEHEDEEEEEYVEGRLLLDELCEGLNKISVNERIAPKFEGKHTRFVYNSDDELVKEEEESVTAAASPNILCLKGLPTPKGKHLRFSEEDE